MNHIKQRTIVALSSGTVQITLNGKIEKTTLNLDLIPAKKHQQIGKENHQGKQLTFYSLSEEKWKVIDFEQVSEIRVLTFFTQTMPVTIFKKLI
ncbi:hypothetical protein [Microscilla marina]|uniref:Uncharacterized protein n=1 Tax=Microscilla marina ATCC 23134 TaxID=313606 RepID=A1ZIP8_MICM2|nr:hypothetical protein [Microscilla marina]EAY29916.1 hypothetical protein M23134_05789 [Microscilla marina ATCC 23134]